MIKFGPSGCGDEFYEQGHNGINEVPKWLKNYGLDAFDRRYLKCIAVNYGGGPVGADTLAAALSEERDTIEEVVEPFLLKLGFIQRTPRGRIISDLGCQYMGIAHPKIKTDNTNIKIILSNSGKKQNITVCFDDLTTFEAELPQDCCKQNFNDANFAKHILNFS